MIELLFVLIRLPDYGVETAYIGAIIGAAAALGSSVLNNYLSSHANTVSYDQTKALMDYQYDKYMNPSAQMNSIARAGISPAIAVSGGAGNNGQFATPSPSVVPPRQIIPIDGVDRIASAVNAMALAKKAGAEIVGKNIENQLMKDTYAERVREVSLQNHWTEEQTAKTTQEVGLLSGQFNEIQQKIENMRSEKALTDKNVEWFNRHMSAEISHLKSSAEYQKAMAGLTVSQKELLDSTMDDLKNITNLNAQQMEKVVELLDKFGSAQAIVGMISQVVGSASDLIGAIAGFKKPTQVTKIIGP